MNTKENRIKSIKTVEFTLLPSSNLALTLRIVTVNGALRYDRRIVDGIN